MSFLKAVELLDSPENSQFLLMEHVPSATWFSVPDLKPWITGGKASIGYINALKASFAI